MSISTRRNEQQDKYRALVAKQAEVESFLEDADRMRAQLKESTVATSIRIRDELTSTSKLLAMSAADGTSPHRLAELHDALALKQAQSNSSAATSVRSPVHYLHVEALVRALHHVMRTLKCVKWLCACNGDAGPYRRRTTTHTLAHLHCGRTCRSSWKRSWKHVKTSLKR